MMHNFEVKHLIVFFLSYACLVFRGFHHPLHYCIKLQACPKKVGAQNYYYKNKWYKENSLLLKRLFFTHRNLRIKICQNLQADLGTKSFVQGFVPQISIIWLQLTPHSHDWSSLHSIKTLWDLNKMGNCKYQICTSKMRA